MDSDAKEKREKRKKRNRIHKVKKRDIGKVRDNIDVTPLVNVGLILLIIFMVITPMMSRGKQVALPKTSYHAAPEDSDQPIVVIDGSENLYVGKQPVENFQEMQNNVTEGWEASESSMRTVYLKVVPEVDYGTVYPVMMALNDIGATNVELGTEEKK